VYHAGFLIARNFAFEEIKKYVAKHASDENFSTENLKIWLTGYSRAGATANMVAGYLDEKISSGDIEYLLGAPVKDKDVYAYCFEPPMGVMSEALKDDINYSNIYNIVNLNDFVTKVAFVEWGFGRYGVDIILPTRETVAPRYDYLYKNMAKVYKDYSKSDAYCNVENIFKNEITTTGTKRYAVPQAKFLDELFLSVSISLIASNMAPDIYSSIMSLNSYKKLIYLYDAINTLNIKPQDIYVSKYQERIMELFEKWHGLNPNFSDLTLSDVLDTLRLVGFIPPNYSATVLDNGNSLVAGHYPDLALAWMKSGSFQN